MPFTYQRTVRFHDTDAAGVVYFANILSMCHEAYEASLAATGITLRTFLSGRPLALPIVHAEADFSQPLFCGESYLIQVQPHRLGSDKFEVHYTIQTTASSPSLSRAKTVHLCIQPDTRTRSPLPAPVEQWLQHWSSPEA